MSNDNGPSEAGARYTSAYEAHYTAKNLRAALGLYQALLSDFPEAPEAGYARSQIQNIVHTAVPIKELFDAQAALALTYLEESNDESEVVNPAPASRLQDVSRAPVQG